MKNKTFIIPSIIICLSHFANAQIPTDTNTVFVGTKSDPISSKLFGFNVIYSEERDADWISSLPNTISKSGFSLIRYPGGEITDRYHWQDPSGLTWVDSWTDPTNKASGSQWMSYTEMLSIKATSINLLS